MGVGVNMEYPVDVDTLQACDDKVIRCLLRSSDGGKTIMNNTLRYLLDKKLIFHTFANGERHQTSFSIGDDRQVNDKIIESKFKCITDAFDLESNGLFDYFKAAVSGEGEEVKRINRLTSSSLLAFLCFATVMARDKKISLEMPPEWYEFAHLDLHDFSHLDLEYENMLAPGKKSLKNRPSSVDVCLCNDKCVLFLESKFSEYLLPAKCRTKGVYIDVSARQYGKRYAEIFDQGPLNPASLQNMWYEDIAAGKIRLKSNDRFYIGGIKQMISHWMGIWYEKTTNAEKQKLWEGKDIVLGEVMFDFGRNGAKDLSTYQAQYKWLAEKLNNLEHGESGITVLPGVLTYQNVFHSIHLPERVHEYYGLGCAMTV